MANIGKTIFFFLVAFSFSPAFATLGLEDFVGRYTYVSGPTGTIACSDYQIELTNDETGLIVYQYNNGDAPVVTVHEFSFVNMGNQPWSYNWGDGTAKGTQITTLKGQSLTNVVRVKALFVTVSKMTTSLQLEGDVLSVSYKSSDTEYECKMQKVSAL